MEKMRNKLVSQQNVYYFIVAPKASAEGPIYGFEFDLCADLTDESLAEEDNNSSTN